MAEGKYDLIIVGAGWYGLIAARTYLKLAPKTRLLILDDGKTIGGVWSSERIYPNLFAQVGHGLFEYSFYPMKKEGLTRDRYISGETIHNYLNSFAHDFGLVDKIQLDTKVTKVERLPGGSAGWRLSTTAQNVPIIETAKLIVASGVTSEPYVPNFSRLRFTKPIIHSSELGRRLKDIGSEKVNRVVVLGAAKSAYDTVFMLLKSGKKVDWIIREDGTGPLAIAPPKLLGLFNSVDLMATRILGSLSPAILQTEGFWYYFLQRNSVGRAFTKLFWRNLSRVAEIHAGYSKSENVGKLEPVPTGFGVFWANSGLGLASVEDFWKVIHAGDVTVHRTSIESFADNVVHLKDGKNIPTDFVLLCTGWKDGLSTFDSKLRAEIGLPSAADLDQSWLKLDAEADAKVDELLPNLQSIPHDTPQSVEHKESEHRPWRLYRRLVSPAMANAQDRSLFIAGQIHSVYTPLVAEMQALWGSAFLLDQIPIPSMEVMRQEIALWNSWTAKRYLAQGRKHAYSIYDYLAYIDSLARDLGIKTNRKSNPVSEMFSTYRPRDYNGIVDEFLEAQTKSSLESSSQVASVKQRFSGADSLLSRFSQLASLILFSVLILFALT